MTEGSWQKFFDLVHKIVNMPNKTAKEKATELRQACKEYGIETDLEELAALIEETAE